MKRFALAMAVLLVLSAASAPAHAGSFGIYGSYWQGNDTDAIWGGGVRVGFEFLKWLELEFHGTYYTTSEEIGGTDIDFTNIPVDGGLKFNILPEKKFNVYVGAGASYYFLDVDNFDIDDEWGYYADGGIEFGGNTKFFAEVLYRFVQGTVEDPSSGSSEDIDFDNFAINAGVNWKW